MDKTFKLQFEADLHINKAKGALADLQKNLSQLKLPDSMFASTTKDIAKLENYIKDFQSLANKTSFSTKDVDNLVKTYSKIEDLTRKLNIDTQAIGGLNINKLLPPETAQRLEQLKGLLEEVQGLIDFKDSKPKQLQTLTDELDTTEKKVDELTNKLKELNKVKEQANKDLINNRVEQANLKEQLKALQEKKKALEKPRGKESKEYKDNEKELDKLEQKAKALQIKIDGLKQKLAENPNNITTNTGLKEKQNELANVQAQIEALSRANEGIARRKPGIQLKEYQDLTTQINELISKLEALRIKENEIKTAQKETGSSISSTTSELDNETEKIANLKAQIDNLNNNNLDVTKLDQIRQTLADMMGVDISQIPTNLEDVKNIINQLSDEKLQAIRTALEGTAGSSQNLTEILKQLGIELGEVKDQSEQFDNRMRDVSALKSRIQYFFGLNNAINLIKRAIRGAFETIKELDKAMTETAVVTDFSVSDMWEQLPEYTKRANELGVTTLSAYQAATLYYQQGLKTNEVNALSVETLKMARIAGLEAAEATDRMTNALRGFNMELTEANAQRVDDVYSELAANTASNVDEISTAMTKVASLAHNANMEFETTAAFLAQIIETTRESAETAGTALKTVVARFSEVKKLVSEDQLKGTDEEGQVIDVNKVSQALRTAGIDLNKYFLGEVGLDDIFIELASKWDNLTKVQQRYIATQAAGSRQQSRFIALMSDYARTQELVGKAYKSNGASAKQFAKTQESLQSKLARLKNAWNEFLMGLANSTIVKSFVDLLTDLLNGINKITSAFGEGTNSVLKWLAAIGMFAGVKGVFRNNGLVDNFLGGLLGRTLGRDATDAVGGSLFKGVIGKAGKAFSLTPGEEWLATTAGRQAGLKSFGVSGLKTGENMARGTIAAAKAGTGGTLSTSLFGTAGAAVPAGTIAGFAGLLIAAEAGLIAWQDYVASGKKDLKKAQKNTEEQRKQLDDTKENNKKQKEAYETFIENEKIARTATNEHEKKQAEFQMQQSLTILKTIDENNVVYDEEGNPRLNVAYAKKKIQDSASEEAMEEAKLAFEEAKQAFASARVEEGKEVIYEYDKNGRIKRDETTGTANVHVKSGSAWEATKHIGGLYDSDEYMLQHAQTYNYTQEEKKHGFEQQAEEKIKEGITTLLVGAFDDNELINTVSNAYATTALKTTTDEKGLTHYNFESKSTGQVQKELSELATIAQQENGKMVLEVLSGTYEGVIDEEQFKKAFEEVNQQYNSILEELFIDSGEDLKQYLAVLKKNQITFRKNAVSTLYKNGLKDFDQLERIGNELSLNQQKKLIEISDSLSGYGEEINGLLTTALSNTMLDPNNSSYNTAQLESFIKSISENPIIALQKLKTVAADTKNTFNNLAAELINIGKQKSGIFSDEGQIQWLLGFGLDEINEEIEELIKNNGKITGVNLQNLAKDCKNLQLVLDNNIISANGLALAINALSAGKISINDLDASVLKLYNSFDTVGNAISRAGQLIKDFDPGEDYGDAYDFINNAIEKITEFVNNRELGNPQLNNYWKLFFKTDPKDLKDWEEGIALLKQLQGNGGANFWTDIIGFKMDKNGNMPDMGLKQFEEFGGSYRDYLKQLAGDKGTQFTDEFYDLMIRNAANHDYGFLQDVAAIELNNLIKAMGDMEIDKRKIQAIADAYGIDPQKVVDAYNKKYDKNLDLSSLEEKVRTQYNKIADVLNPDKYQGEYIKKRKKEGVTDTTAVMEWETGQADKTSFILSQLGADANGNFSIDRLYAQIGEIVPEVKNGEVSAADWVQEQIDANPNKTVKLPVTYEVVDKDENGKWTTQTVTVEVEVDSVEAYNKAAKTLQEQADAQLLGTNLLTNFTEAQDKAQALADFLATLGSNNDIKAISGAIEGCQVSAKTLNETLGADVNKNVNVTVNEGTSTSGTITFTITAAKYGGIVKSYAGGTKNTLSPGLALTGEEKPEIVWNKEKGYAYITGQNGPEFQNLQPGDEVFNGEQTEQILKRSKLGSFAKGRFNSYKEGTIWLPDNKKNGSGSGSGSGSGANDKEEKWKNEVDWLYNLVEDIAELERIQTKLQEDYEDYLTDDAKTSKDLYDLLIKQLGNLYTQLDHQTFALEKREQEMREFMDTTNKYDDYLWYNWDDRTIEIDWDKIEALKANQKDTYDEIVDLISEAEEIQGKMDDAEDAIQDIENQIQELENIWRDTFTDFEKRVYDAIVKSYQAVIDNYSELNDTLNDSNSSILNALQKQIDLERQIRDNTKTEEEIADTESQIAFLQRDTSGGNDLAVLELQKQLEDSRENYSDSLIDQAISRLQEDNDAAAQQREHQIEIMQAQLDYQEQSGEFNAMVLELLQDAMGADGELLTNSDLVTLLKEQENWGAMSDVSKQVWEEELNTTFKEVGAFLLKQNAEENGTFMTALTSAIEAVNASIGSYSQGITKYLNSGSSGSSGGSTKRSTPPPGGDDDDDDDDDGGGDDKTKVNPATQKRKRYDALTDEVWLQEKDPKTKKWRDVGLMQKFQGIYHYATGGLTTKTGPAWLDGTPSEPEYVLNAKQTQAFLKLADVLPTMMSNNSTTNTANNSNISVNISMNVEKIDSDYDVDRIADRVKTIIYDAGSYRNVNTLNFSR